MDDKWKWRIHMMKYSFLIKNNSVFKLFNYDKLQDSDLMNLLDQIASANPLSPPCNDDQIQK